MSQAPAFQDRAALEAIVRRAYEAGRRALGSGAVANYIPELANASPGWFGLVVHPVDAVEPVAVGDSDLAFSLQSVSKIFSLACLLNDDDHAVFERVGVEPSGDAFHSIVRLEEERGIPRNPLINAGAIVVSGRLKGATVDEKIAHFQGFLRGICTDGAFGVDEDVYLSEWKTGFRNRSLANYMRHWETLEDPMLYCETYIRQCAIEVTARGLARLGLFLANGGVDPIQQRTVLDGKDTRTLLAVMLTCGLYDEVGRFAVDVGVPAKSGVSGGLLAVVPGVCSIASYGPALGAKGNSVAGLAALRSLADELNLSIFEPRGG
jgi:glutaminase